MKKILLGLLIVAALSACSSSEEKVDIPTQVQTLNETVEMNANTLTEIKSENEEIRAELEVSQQEVAIMIGHMEMVKAFEETGVTVTKVDEGLNLIFPENLAFKSSEAVLNEEMKAILDPIADTLMAHFDKTDHFGIDIMITGHADSSGPVEFNQKLSEDRAMAVSNYLVDKGIDSSKIETVGVGSSEPRGGKMANRRVDLTIIY